jgi:hypothetical protein
MVNIILTKVYSPLGEKVGSICIFVAFNQVNTSFFLNTFLRKSYRTNDKRKIH